MVGSPFDILQQAGAQSTPTSTDYGAKLATEAGVSKWGYGKRRAIVKYNYVDPKTGKLIEVEREQEVGLDPKEASAKLQKFKADDPNTYLAPEDVKKFTEESFDFYNELVDKYSTEHDFCIPFKNGFGWNCPWNSNITVFRINNCYSIIFTKI